MASFNKWIGAGNVTRDPQIKNLPSGTVVAEFGLACNRKFKDKESVLFIDCAAFGKQAEIIGQYVTKGKPLLVEARLELQQWEDKQGQKRSKISAVVENFQFLGDGNKGGQNEPAGVGAGLMDGATAIPEDESPF